MDCFRYSFCIALEGMRILINARHGQKKTIKFHGNITLVRKEIPLCFLGKKFNETLEQNCDSKEVYLFYITEHRKKKTIM